MVAQPYLVSKWMRMLRKLGAGGHAGTLTKIPEVTIVFRQAAIFWGMCKTRFSVAGVPVT